MRFRGVMALMLLVPMLGGFDCGNGGETKLDACIRLGKAYCKQEIAVGCPDPTSPCTSENCYEFFDSKCLATAEEIDKVDHDIKMIIRSKSTCDGLRSVDDYLISTVLSMASAECVNSGAYDGRGQMCADMIDAYCDKVVDLGCTMMSRDDCVSMSWVSGMATLGDGYYCSDPNDESSPTPINIAAFKEAMAEIKAADTCD